MLRRQSSKTAVAFQPEVEEDDSPPDWAKQGARAGGLLLLLYCAVVFVVGYTSASVRSPEDSPAFLEPQLRSPLRTCSLPEAAYERLDRELGVFAFAANETSGPPSELASTYLMHDYAVVRIRNQKPTIEEFASVFHWKYEPLKAALAGLEFPQDFPDIEFIINLLDEPRIARSGCFRRAYASNDISLLEDCADAEGMNGRWKSTSSYLSESCYDTVNEFSASHGFFISASTVGFSRPRIPFPVFSVSKIDDCFEDILVPWPYHYAPFMTEMGELPPWSQKENKVLWRGSTTGVESSEDTKTVNSHRFRLVDFAFQNRNRPGIPALDVEFTGDGQCKAQVCDVYRARLAARISTTDFLKAKYNVVVDGNTASMSEFTLLQGNSVLFRDSIFSSFYSDWFTAGADYFQVKPDMSDFLPAIQTAVRTESASATAATARSRKAKRLLSKGAMNCYWIRALSRYARVYPNARL